MTQDHDKATIAPGHGVYGSAARHMHWATAGAVLVMVPLGLAMSYRGNTLDIWDGLTDALYSSHKTLGFLVLWLVAGRLTYRLIKGAPPDEPTLLWWHKAASHLVHWLLYGLLIVVPLLGWIGVSLYPSLTLFGLVDLPALASPNEELAKTVLGVHGKLAIAMALLACGHIAAALYHHFIRKDGVLRRMLPGLK
ncbi:MAG TPA: cytochrome b [Bosea sp. (in: a-proteobacteria)]|jgi:cytochrome b561|uniref:cytochrome b n=1 Tax=Bosea sp. (in: a-proteobacteria) TaxID=1871050 RepID=UPI002E162A6A|nr:cytochrome b [Bosea sp. (in: a-proteobacteria)]